MHRSLTMVASRWFRHASVMALVAVVADCGVLHGDGLEPGWRRIVVTVTNNRGKPATFVVAHNHNGMRAVVGRVNPHPVPVGVTDVTFDLPPDQDWGVRKGPPGGTYLFLAEDIPPDATGKAPQTIVIDKNGQITTGGFGLQPDASGAP